MGKLCLRLTVSPSWGKGLLCLHIWCPLLLREGNVTPADAEGQAWILGWGSSCSQPVWLRPLCVPCGCRCKTCSFAACASSTCGHLELLDTGTAGALSSLQVPLAMFLLFDLRLYVSLFSFPPTLL